ATKTKEEPPSEPASPETISRCILDTGHQRAGLEDEALLSMPPTDLIHTVIQPIREVSTPIPLDLSHREKATPLKTKPQVSGVTLFPGLTITPGRGEGGGGEAGPDTTQKEDNEEERATKKQKGEDAPLTPSPTPSPPENSFPRFHFGRGNSVNSVDKKKKPMSSSPEGGDSPLAHPHSQGRSRETEGVPKIIHISNQK
ncbi:hypothetical protein SK128_025654, partial [Halocaridina rubra]